MKKMFIFTATLIGFLIVNAQDIIVKDLNHNSSSIVLSNDDTININFQPKYFNIEGIKFNFKERTIFSDKEQQREIGKYGIDQLILNDGRNFSFKFDKRKNTIQIKDKNKNIVFIGDLKFHDRKKRILDKIIISKNTVNSEIVEYWISLCTMNKLYGNQNKEFFKQIVDGFIFGATASAVSGVIK